MIERDGTTSNERTKNRRARRKRAMERKLAGFRPDTDHRLHLLRLFQRQNGLCAICGKPAVLDGKGGAAGSEQSAVRFRTGSSFGAPGRRRPRVMAHRGCAQKRSGEIQDSIDIDELRHRARAFPVVTFALPEENLENSGPHQQARPEEHQAHESG